MKDPRVVELLTEAWMIFLQERGHEVCVPERITDAVTSHDKEHSHFRWLLFVAGGKIKELRASERQQLAREIQIARRQRQKPFVVVHFGVPRPKVIIKPAEKALETGRIGSARGGIPWFE